MDKIFGSTILVIMFCDSIILPKYNVLPWHAMLCIYCYSNSLWKGRVREKHNNALGVTPITKHTIFSVFVGSYGQNVFILWSIGKGLRLESRESRFASLACNNCSVFSCLFGFLCILYLLSHYMDILQHLQAMIVLFP